MKLVAPLTTLALLLSLGSGEVRAEGELQVIPDSQSQLAQEKKPGTFTPGQGFLIAESEYASLSIGVYILVRYINQAPAEQTFTDHLGRVHDIDTRADIQLHREMIFFKGHMYSPKLQYYATVWGVNSTNDVALVGGFSYEFGKAFILAGGIDSLPGIRSLNLQHPYFLGTDRQMAEDFFRPGFTSGITVRGEPVDGFSYRAMLGSNLSQIRISSKQLTRDKAYGLTLFWEPTTGEFGPRGGFGDYELHDKLATKFGVSTVHSREDRYNQTDNTFPDNTQLRLSDSLLLFETGSLAPGVTVQKADYTILAVDAAMKHRGWFLFAEAYFRWLDHFVADGPIPQSAIFDRGFEVQIAYQFKPQKLELFAVTSQIFGAFNHPWEVALGANYYPFNTRNYRLNGIIMYEDRTAPSSSFGYYVGGQKGPTLVIASDVYF